MFTGSTFCVLFFSGGRRLLFKNVLMYASSAYRMIQRTHFKSLKVVAQGKRNFTRCRILLYQFHIRLPACVSAAGTADLLYQALGFDRCAPMTRGYDL